MAKETIVNLEKQLLDVKQSFFECFDANTGEEVSDSEKYDLEIKKLSDSIEKRINGYAMLLENKFDKEFIARAKEKRAQIDADIKDFESKIAFIKYKLNEYIGDRKYIKVPGFIKDFFVSPAISKVKDSVDISLLEDEYKVFNIKTTMAVLKNYLDEDKLKRFISDEAVSLKETASAGIPRDHKSIKYKITPTVKITKTEPK